MLLRYRYDDDRIRDPAREIFGFGLATAFRPLRRCG